MARGGKSLRNTPALKGMPAQGSRPAGSGKVVPNGQYPTILGTRKLPAVPGINVVPGQSTVNSTPAKGGRTS